MPRKRVLKIRNNNLAHHWKQHNNDVAFSEKKNISLFDLTFFCFPTFSLTWRSKFSIDKKTDEAF